MSAIEQILEHHRELIDRLDALGVPGRPPEPRRPTEAAIESLVVPGADGGAWTGPADGDEAQAEETEALLGEDADDVDEAARGRAVTSLLDALVAHLLVEEQILYPQAWMAGAGTLVQEAVSDHEALRRLLHDLRHAVIADDASQQAHLHRLRDVLDAHVDLVEQRVLPFLRDTLGAERLDELGLHMEAKVQVQRVVERHFVVEARNPPAGRGSSR